MPPIREHKSSPSPTSQNQQNLLTSTSEDDLSKTEKPSSILKRSKRSPSINTRASRVGVTNFINVIKNLHPGESLNYFPITKETLQEYIDSKRKALIKAGSLEQYLQHIQAYNIALGFGWDGHVFGPIIKKALDELRIFEDENSMKTGNILVISSPQQQQPTLVNTVISSQLFSSSLDSTANNVEDAMELVTIDENDNGKSLDDDPIEEEDNNEKSVSLVCFNATNIPFVILGQVSKVFLDNLNSHDTIQNLRQLYANISVASVNFPKSWGPVDTSKLYYRIIGSSNDTPPVHHTLTDVASFNRFWSSLNDRDMGKEVQLIVYQNNNGLPLLADQRRIVSSSPEPMSPISPSHRPLGYCSPVLKSVTVKSKTKVYKQKIAVADTTTFSSLISFAIKVSPPSGKQFVIRAADGALEYMPNDLVREVITGVEHTEIIVCIEDEGPPINFDYF